jgi:photosystem II stability/assembly factor-like uncharacterized protein
MKLSNYLFLITILSLYACKKEPTTTNNNYTWSQVKSTSLNGVTNNGDYLFFYDDGNLLYTSQENTNSGGGGTYTSSDGGQNWTRIAPSCEQVVKSGNNLILNRAPNGSANIYSNGALTLINSLCGGTLNPQGGCIDLRNFYTINNTVIAATNRGVLKSQDNGLTWSYSNTGISTYNFQGQTSIMGLSSIVSIGQNIFVTTEYLESGVNTVFKSSNNGNTWTQCNIGGLNVNPSQFKKMIAVGGVLYILYQTGSGPVVIKSEDLGNSWVMANLSMPSGNSLEDFASNNTFMFALSNNEVYKTNNHGASWEKISPDDFFISSLGDPDILRKITVAGNRLFVSGEAPFTLSYKGKAYCTSL